ncbi:MAG: hypothetical protein KDH09_19865, partial [Chrysiogenetes bacterium]|nr:hypothetical protein [Chrysiogenetes bacterium]
MNQSDPITQRNTGEVLVRQIPDCGISLHDQAALTGEQVLALQARSKLARQSAVRAVDRVGEDHLGGGLEVIDPLELVLSVMDRSRGDDFFIAQGHVAAGYFAVLSQHGLIDPNDFEQGFRTSEPIGGHVTPLSGGTMNTGRLGDEGGGVGMALANQVTAGREKGIVFLFTSDGSMQEGSASEAFEIAANRSASVIFIPALNAMQLSGTTASVDPKGNPAGKARAAGLTVIDVPSVHDFAGLYKALHEAATLCAAGKGPVFLNPVGEKKKASEVFADPKAWEIDAGEEVWVPGSLMGSGIKKWEEGIIATIHAESKGKPLAKPVNYHDGNLKNEDAAAILAALEPTAEEKAALAATSGKSSEYKFHARPKWDTPTGYEFSWPKTFDISKSARLDGDKHGGDWVSPRKGVNVALQELGAKNSDQMMAFDMDLGGSTQLGALASHIGKRFVQTGIRERAGILAAGGAAYEMLQARAAGGNKGKVPTACTATFAAFLQGVGREGLEFADYQQDLYGYDAGGLTTGVPLKVISSHNGLNPGKDGITAHALHGIDLAFELPRLRRCFLPADANHAVHIIREMFSLSDYAMYVGPRDVVPVIADPADPSKPLFGPDWKWEAVTAIEKKDGAKAAILVTGPVLYRALMAADKLSTPTDVYFIGQVKPFPTAAVMELLAGYDAVVTLEDGFVGGEDSWRGLAGLVAGTLAANVTDLAARRSGTLPRIGKV